MDLVRIEGGLLAWCLALLMEPLVVVDDMMFIVLLPSNGYPSSDSS